jgi:HD-GYP domain-containing protein (c-di-GMP phosphodiesterase class II)
VCLFGGIVAEFNINDIDNMISREFLMLSNGDVDISFLITNIVESVLEKNGSKKCEIYIINGNSYERLSQFPKMENNKKNLERDGSVDQEVVRKLIENGKSSFEDYGKIVYIPVISSGETIGFFEIVANVDSRAFTYDTVVFFEIMAQKLSPFFKNMRLVREKEKSLNQISELMEISRILNLSLEPKVVRKKAIKAVTRLLNCETASLLLLDENADELYFEVALGDKGDKVKEIRLKLGEGIAGWVAKNNEAVLINDVKVDKRHSSKADKKSTFITKNMVCVPMVVKGKVNGVLQAINKMEEGEFLNDDLDLLKSLSNQVAIAVDNARLHDELRETFFQTAEALAVAIEKRDPYTGNHIIRVMKYSMVLADCFNISDDEKESLRLASILHDVGKIGVEDSILRKDSALTELEFKKMKEHPSTGEEILGHIKMLKKVLPAMKHHHERIDGGGYPDGLKNDNIPLLARIIAVADTFDAMTTDRPYRRALSDEEALNELKNNAGKQFDEKVVKSFIVSYENGRIKGRKNN